MRCPDCNKFVTDECTEDPEVEDLEVTDNEDGTVIVTGSVRIVLACPECSQELREGRFEIEEMFSVSSAVEDEEEQEEHSHEWEASIEPTYDNWYDGKTRTLKNGTVKTTPLRYQKHYHGAQGTLTLRCGTCDEEHTADWKEGMPGSALEELV